MLCKGPDEHFERKAMEEVAPVKLNHYAIERPSMLLPASCAPVAWLPESAPVALLAAEQAQVSRAHQVQIQAELVRTLVDGSYGTTGFVGSNGVKRVTDGASGVPPRGRPV
jgi:hypothetical protein